MLAEPHENDDVYVNDGVDENDYDLSWVEQPFDCLHLNCSNCIARQMHLFDYYYYVHFGYLYRIDIATISLYCDQTSGNFWARLYRRPQI
jgi:hypothetical protein